MRLRIGDGSQVQQGRSQSTMCSTEHGNIAHLLRQGQERLSQGVSRLVLGAYEIIIPESTQHGEKLVGVSQVFTEVSSGRVRLSHFGSGIAFRGNQRGS